MEWGGALKSWNDPDVVGSLIGFGTIGLLFCLHGWYLEDNAMIPRSLISQKLVIVNCGVIFFLSASFFILLYYLPLYLQVVQGLSATSSGIRTVPLVLGCGILLALSGVYMSTIGYKMPPMLLGSAATASACGVFTMMDQHSNAGFWIGLQVLAGVGVGVACQVPMIVNQASVEPSKLASVMAITLLFQMAGGSIFLQLDQSLLTNTLASYLVRQGGSSGHYMDPMAALHSGASEVSRVIDSDTSTSVLEAYMSGLQSALFLAATLASISTIFGGFTGFGTIKRDPRPQASEKVAPEISEPA